MENKHQSSLPSTPYLTVNDVGHLEFNECNVVTLAKEYGTPLYVMNEDGIRQKCRVLKEQFMNRHPNTQVLYAGKAFNTIAMCRIIQEEGLGLDVVSGGELSAAVRAGVTMKNVYFHGNNKSEEEIRMAFQYGVGRFVSDSRREIELLNQIAGELGQQASVLLRISPGVDGHTHEYMQTGVLDCKFGFPIEGGHAMDAVQSVLECPNLNFVGVHCHIGSQILTAETYPEAATVMIGLVRDIFIACGVLCQELNLGGGYGIRYTDDDEPFDLIETLDAVVQEIETFCGEHHMIRPKLLIEPGRWIVAENGVTLYSIGGRRDIPGVRNYVSVDGSMCDNPRPMLYQAKYQGVVAGRMNEPEAETVTIAGRCCESGDILIKDLELPVTQPGDILAVLGTGAYNYSMSSNYNRLRKPPVVMIRQGIPRIIVRGETYDDVLRNDID